MNGRSVTDKLYGLLGQHKKGIPMYKYGFEDNQFYCTTTIESMNLETTEYGSSKKIARELSAQKLYALVEENLKRLHSDYPISSPSVKSEKMENGAYNNAGLHLMLVNSWLYNYRRKPIFEHFYLHDKIGLRMRLFVPEVNLDEQFEASASASNLAKQQLGLLAFQFLESRGLISSTPGKPPAVKPIESKRVDKKTPPIQATISVASSSLLDEYLTAINEYPDKVPVNTASTRFPVELLQEKRFETTPEILDSKLFTEAPLTNWDPWRSCPIKEGLWYGLTQEKASSMIHRLEKRIADRKNLPIFNKKCQIQDTVRENPVTIIAGGTGSGKSTQVVQYLLEEFVEYGDGAEFAAYVTEPRKIAAISLAKRVASERKEKVGTSIGYCVRLDNCLPRPYGAVVFCTTGILLRKLHGGLRGISHLIIDEVHERSLETDFLLILIKKILQKGSSLKVILMSASMDTEVFSAYFGNCPIINVEGQLFPVDTYYLQAILEKLGVEDQFPLQRLEEYEEKPIYHLPMPEAINVIEKIIVRILNGTPRGSILVFMPGWFEITQTKDLLEKNSKISEVCIVFPLHSSVTKEEQNKVFLPSSKLKIILSTNIAESSLTIDDVSYVIDSCRHREAQKHKNVTQLDTVWISKSSLIQRRGRAGRVKQGVCFHLCTEEHQEVMPENSVPEILRLSLDGVILQIKALGIGDPSEVLKMAIDPPSENYLEESMYNLRMMGAFNSENKLTKLGHILSKFPVSPHFGKAIVLGTILGIGPIVCELMAMISVGSPYSSSESETLSKNNFECFRFSDHINLVQIIQSYLRHKEEDPTEAERFANGLDLKVPVLALATKVKNQLIDILLSFGFPSQLFYDNPILDNSSEEILDLLLAVLTSALYPNVCYVKDRKKVITMDGSTAIFPNGLDTGDPSLLVFTEKIVSRTSICKESSVISPIYLMLFCSQRISCIGIDKILLDDRFVIEMDADIVCKIASLRPHIEVLINKTCDVCYSKDVLTKEDYMLVDLLIELCLT